MFGSTSAILGRKYSLGYVELRRAATVLRGRSLVQVSLVVFVFGTKTPKDYTLLVESALHR